MNEEPTIPELDALVKMMEEMAGLPREELGKRQPGERQAREIYANRENV